MAIRLIYAVSENLVIGRSQRLPWHIPEDIKRFQKLTEGHVVVMGLNTWHSLPGKYRPLKNRINVVLSTKKDLKIPGAEIRHDIASVVEEFKDKDIWFIGGSRVLSEAMAAYADEIKLTYIMKKVNGDVYGPNIDIDIWKIDHKSEIFKSGDLNYQYIDLSRRIEL